MGMNIVTDAAVSTHIAFADETHHNVGRYRGVALISMPYDLAALASHDVRHLLTQSDVSEFKWSKLRTAKTRFAAMKLLDYVIAHAITGDLRVDVLTWDTEDFRHKVIG